ncbi:Membrane-bound lytic murein transglycosylase A [Candidatus Magnetaquicoccaceae bacterium FCR-1]|uniref:peptidoglycan lytic exotransglycosylase n=1 Tax=Candidatus Magnetaquiglobus chichijimensis TaxID=3141448 RepID=A0ABQ0CDH8_9PROT
MARYLLAILLVGWVAACSGPAPEKKITEENSLTLVPWSQVAKAIHQDSDLASWADALEASAGYYASIPPETMVRFGPRQFSAETMVEACKDLARSARSMESTALLKHLETNYLLLRSVGSDQQGDVLVTAYFEPLLRGSLTQTKTFAHPIYRRPRNLVEVDLSEWSPEFKDKRIIGRIDKGRLRPYYDRARIDQEKVLKGGNLELAWVDDPIDLFFLHIQGSGRVQLPDGSTLRVGYAATNGQPYRSIGALLIEENQISKENMSMPALRQWLKDNPKQRDRVLNANPSYVFFRKLEGGPFGNIGVPLTGERSMATDATLFPKGAPGLLHVTLPEINTDGSVSTWQPTLRFTVNQDTGGAIRGPGRVDYFMGFGERAMQIAGIMKQRASSLYFIAPRPPDEPRPGFFARIREFFSFGQP